MYIKFIYSICVVSFYKQWAKLSLAYFDPCTILYGNLLGPWLAFDLILYIKSPFMQSGAWIKIFRYRLQSLELMDYFQNMTFCVKTKCELLCSIIIADFCTFANLALSHWGQLSFLQLNCLAHLQNIQVK